MTKLKNKKNRQRILSILLVFALVITGLFAFLSATDTKTNVFTIGNIKAELWEDFDIDKDGTITDGTNGDPDNVFGPETPQPPTVENILPGDTILKQPYVKNTGANEEWVYMIVAVPLEDKDDLVSTSDGSIALTANATDDVEERVLVTAVAVQDNFDGENTLSGIWGKLTAAGGMLDSSTYFGTASNDADLVPVFSINGLDTTNWTALPIGSTAAGQPFKSSNGYNYYAYGYSTKLAPKADNESVYPQTSALFQSVTFANAIGETLPVVVNYFAPVSSGSGSSGTGAGEADLSLFTPSIPGYELVHQDQVTPNSPITLYFDDSLAQTGKTFSWVDSETNKEAWTGMTVSDTTNLLANYNNRASASAMEQSYDWLSFDIKEEDGRLVAWLNAPIDETRDSYTAWLASDAGQAGEIVVPSEIEITITGSNARSQQALCHGTSSTTVTSSIAVPSIYADQGTCSIPVTGCYVNICGIAEFVKKATLPDSIKHLDRWFLSVNSSGSCSLLEEINIPYGCVSLGLETGFGSFTNDRNLVSVSIPSSVITIGVRAFENTSLNEVIIPKSVTHIGNSAFANINTLERLVVLPSSMTVPDVCFVVAGTPVEYIYWNADSMIPLNIKNGSNAIANCEIVVSSNVKLLKDTCLDTSLANNNVSIKYCGSEAEFMLMNCASMSTSTPRTVSEKVENSNGFSTTSHCTYNCTDPYAA